MDKDCVTQVKGLIKITFVSCTKNHPFERAQYHAQRDNCFHVDLGLSDFHKH